MLLTCLAGAAEHVTSHPAETPVPASPRPEPGVCLALWPGLPTSLAGRAHQSR